jgi:hypothetical protein
MAKYIKLKTIKSSEIIIYFKRRFKEFSLRYLNRLNSLTKSELMSRKNKNLEIVDSYQIKNSLSSSFNDKISVLTDMDKDKDVNNTFAFSKIHIKLNSYEIK